MPTSFGTWSSTMTSPMPALKPVSTGVDMKFATKPEPEDRRADQQHAGQRGQRRGCAVSLTGSPSGTTNPSCAPVRIASVVVELTLSTRDVPMQRVDDQGNERGVEPDADGSPATVA